MAYVTPIIVGIGVSLTAKDVMKGLQMILWLGPALPKTVKIFRTMAPAGNV